LFHRPTVSHVLLVTLCGVRTENLWEQVLYIAAAGFYVVYIAPHIFITRQVYIWPCPDNTTDPWTLNTSIFHQASCILDTSHASLGAQPAGTLHLYLQVGVQSAGHRHATAKSYCLAASGLWSNKTVKHAIKEHHNTNTETCTDLPIIRPTTLHHV